MKRTAFGLLMVGALVAVTACSSGAGGDSSGGDDAIVIGYSNPQGSQVSLQSIGHGMEDAISQLGLSWEVSETDAKLSGDKQVSDIDTMITQGVGGIASWTLNSGAMEAVYSRAKEAGIPVIGLNSESPSVTTNVKTETDSTCVVGEQQAAYIAERIPGARVLMIEGPEIPSITFTTQCFKDAAEAAGLTIAAAAPDTNGSEASGQKVAETLLAANAGGFDAVWSFADQTGVGVSAALQTEGLEIWTEDKPSGIVAISRDGAAAAIENIKRGALTASWDGNFPQIGAAVVELLNRHYVDGVALEELPAEVIVPSTRWDLSNVGDYIDEMDRKVELTLGK